MDSTESIRQTMVEAINSEPNERQSLEKQYGQVWDTRELQKDFNVKGYAAPFIIVERKADNKLGTLMFQHMPRYYFSFTKNGK